MNQSNMLPNRRLGGLLLGPTLFVLLLLLPTPQGLDPTAWRVAALTLLMATWWVTEAVPTAVTALLPLPLLPLLGVADIHTVAAPYANPIIFLFLGGFLLALALQHSGLHRRLAMAIVRISGDRPNRLIAGFMLATAGLSMWVSNTATAALMLPVALSVATLLGPIGGSQDDTDTFTPALLLAIAFSASVGGVATLIGTPPNALLAAHLSQQHDIQIGFAQWMVLGLPLSLTLLVIIWLLLTRVSYRVPASPIPGIAAMLATESTKLGRPSGAEIGAGTVFVLTGLAWMLRPWLEQRLPEGVHLSDAGIAMCAGILLFMIPGDWRRGRFLLDWNATRELPWGVLLLFGGGLSLGAAIGDSGLANWLAEQVLAPSQLPLVVLIALVALLVNAVSHFTSNTAATATFLPLLAGLAATLGIAPLWLLLPATLAASCVFMLPVATPPNAIIFGSGMLSVAQMVRAGVLVNLAALGLIVLLVLVFPWQWLFGQ
jgi:sodium-dependent dicarboxylate transporter 2/3/5